MLIQNRPIPKAGPIEVIVETDAGPVIFKIWRLASNTARVGVLAPRNMAISFGDEPGAVQEAVEQSAPPVIQGGDDIA